MKIATASLGIGLMISACPAWADQATKWASVGDWQVMFDSVDHGCFMLASFTRGTIIRIGLDNKNNKGYLILGNPAWHSLEVGKEYKISMQFDGDSPWSGTFTAVKFGDRGGGSVFLANYFFKIRFLQDIAAKQKVTIYYNDKRVTQLPLTGTSAAVRSMVQCQVKMAGTSTDPFADSPRSTDPFSDSEPVSDPFGKTPRGESF